MHTIERACENYRKAQNVREFSSLSFVYIIRCIELRYCIHLVQE